MKTVRRLLVFPFELLLAFCTCLFVVIDVTCILLGQLCQFIEGE